MSKKGQLARALFEEGYNCAQSVAGAFAEELGLPRDTVIQMVSGFGGGFGRLREVCGCFSGITLVLGTLRGYNDPKDAKGKQKLYHEVQELAEQFRAEKGSIICRDLLAGVAKTEGSVPEERTAGYYERRPCPGIAEYAADLLERYLSAEGCNAGEAGVISEKTLKKED